MKKFRHVHLFGIFGLLSLIAAVINAVLAIWTTNPELCSNYWGTATLLFFIGVTCVLIWAFTAEVY